MIQSPLLLLLLLIAIVKSVTTLSNSPSFKKFFKYLPAPLWCYFLPTLLSTFGIIPSENILYTYMSRFVLPACLVLLLVGTDLLSILKLSPRAILAMAAGSVGILLGGTVTFVMIEKQVPELWRGWPCLSASWTGGSANMISVREILQTPAPLFSNLVIVDTVIAYSWMAFLVYISKYRAAIDNFLGATDLAPDESISDIENLNESDQAAVHPAVKVGILIILAFGMAGLFWMLSGIVPQTGQLLNRFTWLIIFSTLVPLGLSLTPAKRLENWGASAVGNFLLYLLLTSIGAKANLTTLAHAPFMIALGFLWAGIHGVTLLVYGKISKTPISILAASSQANIGGTVSTPLVASVYDRRLAPMGLILAVLGNIYGTYFGLFFSKICRWLSSFV